MIEITRRAAIIGSALVAVVTAGLVGVTFAINPKWNHGGEPWQPTHPNPIVNKNFDPKYIMLLYMDIEDSYKNPSNPTQEIGDILRMRAIRLHFKTIDSGTPNPDDNTWKTNQQQIIHWINTLNSTTSAPTPNPPDLYVKQGLQNLIFGQPHHVIIYIQNSNIDFDPDHPIWFGDTLLNPGSGPNPEKAAPNWSFFAAKVETPLDTQNNPAITGNFSKKFIYVKNFFRGKGLFNTYYPISIRHSYALNINAIIRVTDTAGGDADTSGTTWANRIPIIIDPDTGNEGGGEP